jgi:hypothetical protein
MQDRKGADPGYLVPGTWYLAPVPNSHISDLNKALPVTRHSLLVTPSHRCPIRRTCTTGYRGPREYRSPCPLDSSRPR